MSAVGNAFLYRIQLIPFFYKIISFVFPADGQRLNLLTMLFWKKAIQFADSSGICSLLAQAEAFD